MRQYGDLESRILSNTAQVHSRWHSTSVKRHGSFAGLLSLRLAVALLPQSSRQHDSPVLRASRPASGVLEERGDDLHRWCIVCRRSAARSLVGGSGNERRRRLAVGCFFSCRCMWLWCLVRLPATPTIMRRQWQGHSPSIQPLCTSIALEPPRKQKLGAGSEKAPRLGQAPDFPRGCNVDRRPVRESNEVAGAGGHSGRHVRQIGSQCTQASSTSRPHCGMFWVRRLRLAGSWERVCAGDELRAGAGGSHRPSLQGSRLQTAEIRGPSWIQDSVCPNCWAYFWERAAAWCKACPQVPGGCVDHLRKLRSGIFPHRLRADWTITDIRRHHTSLSLLPLAGSAD